MANITITGDLAGIVARWKNAARVTAADAQYALGRQKTRVLDRTARGTDFEGRAFKSYATKEPYTYYPNGRVGSSRFTDRQNRAAVSRLKRKLEKAPQKNAGGIRLTRTGRGIVFAHYAAFKRWLGRAFVDLRGPRAPNMLQGLVVKIAGSGNQPVNEARLGIYGTEAARADGHNKGTRRLPKRKFLGASESDKRAIANDIMQRIRQRLDRK